jgi:hypothetical protein
MELWMFEGVYDVDEEAFCPSGSHELDPTRDEVGITSRSTTRFFVVNESHQLLTFVVVFPFGEVVFNMAKCFLSFEFSAPFRDLLVFALSQTTLARPETINRATTYLHPQLPPLMTC